MNKAYFSVELYSKMLKERNKSPKIFQSNIFIESTQSSTFSALTKKSPATKPVHAFVFPLFLDYSFKNQTQVGNQHMKEEKES